MKTSLPGFAIMSLLSSTMVWADALDDVKEQFIGDYELVTYVSFPAAGGEIDNDYIGRLSYDRFGNMSGLGMPRNLPERQSTSTERLTSGFGYWGSVSFNLDNNTVIHHVEGSPMVAQWVGGENVRFFEFVGHDILKLSLKDQNGRVTGTLTWRRLK